MRGRRIGCQRWGGGGRDRWSPGCEAVSEPAAVGEQCAVAQNRAACACVRDPLLLGQALTERMAQSAQIMHFLS